MQHTSHKPTLYTVLRAVLLFTVLFGFPLCVVAVTPVLPDDFPAFMRSSPAPGVYQLTSGVFKSSEDNTFLFLRDGQFDGTPDTPLVIQGEGSGKTIIECYEVCYFTRSDYITFRNLTIRGYMNSDHMRNAVFENVAWEDPFKIGPVEAKTERRHGILFKAASTGPDDIDPGAGPITFIQNTFNPVDGGFDTTLDFVGVQGVSITGSTWIKCNRGCLQAKGGSGVLVPFTIKHNLILDAGNRGIFLGGATDFGRFHPPVPEAKGEFGGADVSDNIILGGDACATFSSIAGPVRFHHNFCRGGKLWQIRMLIETAYPAFMDAGAFRNLTVDHNVFADWSGQWANIISGLSQLGDRWGAASNETIAIEHNLFNTYSGQNFWPDLWAQEGNIEARQAVVFSEDGRSVVSADGVEDVSIYGPRTRIVEPNEPDIGNLSVYVVLTENGSLLFLDMEAAVKAADGNVSNVIQFDIVTKSIGIEVDDGNQ